MNLTSSAKYGIISLGIATVLSSLWYSIKFKPRNYTVTFKRYRKTEEAKEHNPIYEDNDIEIIEVSEEDLTLLHRKVKNDHQQKSAEVTQVEKNVQKSTIRKEVRQGVLKKGPLPHYYTDVGITLRNKYKIGFSDRYMFPYLINNTTICSYQEKLNYIILIVTATHDYHLRSTLRETWARPNLMRNYPSRTVFLLGSTNITYRQTKIQEESEKYGDIVQADFVDSYHNITFKVMVGIKWILTYCPQVKYIFRVNDNVFIDIFTLVKIVNSEIAPDKKIMAGYPYINSVEREKSYGVCSKWCAADHDHSHIKYFPSYLFGDFYILSRKVLPYLYKKALTTNYFWVEDVFLTGFCRENMFNVSLVNYSLFYEPNSLKFLSQYWMRPLKQKKFYTTTDMNRIMWKQVMRHLTKEDKIMFGLPLI